MGSPDSPTLARPAAACPRCDGRRLVSLAADPDRAFEWHECEECRYLWATPQGWTPHPESRDSYRAD